MVWNVNNVKLEFENFTNQTLAVTLLKHRMQNHTIGLNKLQIENKKQLKLHLAKKFHAQAKISIQVETRGVTIKVLYCTGLKATTIL